MDPFNDLPAEMLLEILLSVRLKESMNSLIRASPALLRSYVSFKARISRNLVAADLDDELVQHAVAIVQFPDTPGPGEEHLATWNGRQLPNPLRGHYPEIFEEVNKLHSIILRLIQDYITKAISRFPPREYLCLPNIHASPADGHSIFRGQRITTMVQTDVLTDNERKRFLKAFLLFELNCKAIKSGITPRPEPGNGSPYEVPIVLVSLRDNDAFQCIHTYLCSLHGAIFAQCGDAWLPEPPNESSHEPGLLFPDSLYLDPNTYMSDLGIPQANGVERATEFAKFGLELVVELLGYDISDPHQKERLLARLYDFWNSNPRLGREFRPLIVEMSPELVDKAFIYRILDTRLKSPMGLQEKIFEQRAWAFFDDARLYPDGFIATHFPSHEFLENEGDEMVWFEGWEQNSARIRALCRSQKWHDDYKKEIDSDNALPYPHPSCEHTDILSKISDLEKENRELKEGQERLFQLVREGQDHHAEILSQNQERHEQLMMNMQSKLESMQSELREVKENVRQSKTPPSNE